MQLAILLLLVAALVLLVLALIGGNTTLAIVSIVVSLLAIGAIVRGRRQRQELAGQRQADADRQARVEADRDETTRVLAAATAEASRRAAAAPDTPAEPVPVPAAASVPAEPAAVPAVVAPDPTGAELGPDEDAPPADTIAPLQRFAQSRVWVIDGRPRYHLAECERLDGHVPEAIALSQAVEDGFTPCSLCDPDNKLAG